MQLPGHKDKNHVEARSRRRIDVSTFLGCVVMTLSFILTPLSLTAGTDQEAVLVVLTSNGLATWPVVVGHEADARVREAAQDLADVLGRITGAEFAVTEGDGLTGIAVGTAADFPLLDWTNLFDPTVVSGREDYVLRSHDKGLWLVGARPVAARHAVWDLLQRLGYRYYFPSPDWEIVPSISDLVVAVDVFERPAYHERDVGRTLRLTRASWLQERVGVWQVRNRAASDFQLATSHAYQDIVRRNQAVFDAHPEYLALVDGERRGNKMCISNPDLRALVAHYAEGLLLADPELDSVSLEPSDGGDWCECADCEALGSPSNRAVVLANEVAAAINALGLGPKYVGMYAYNWHSPPPTIDVHPNVIVSLEDTHLRYGTTLGAMLTGWGARAHWLGRREAYARSSSSDSGFLPGGSRASDLSYIQQTLPYWHDRGVRFLKGGGNAHWGMNGIGYYLAARMLWDVAAAEEQDTLLDEFLGHSFGPAAEAMRGYFTAINRATEVAWVPGLRLPVEQRIGRMYQALAAARPLAPDDAVRTRIDDLILYTRFVDLYQQARASQEDFDALVTHIWRSRKRNMIDVINTLVYVDRFIVEALDHVVWGEGGGSTSPAYRHRQHEDEPFSAEEMGFILMNGVAAYPVIEVKVDVVDFGPGLIPAGFDAAMAVPRGYPSFYGSEGHRGDLVLELWSDDLDLPVLYFSAGHCWSGRGPLRWTLHAQDGRVIQVGDIPADVDPPRQSVSGGEAWLAAPFTRALALVVPEPGVYRLVVTNTDQGYFWDYEPRAGAGLVIRADTVAPVRSQWLSRHYFYVPKGVDEIHLWGELREGRHDWIRPDGETVPVEEVCRLHGFTLIPVPQGMDGQVWSFNSRHSRPELRFLNVPGLLAYHPGELVVPLSLADEIDTGVSDPSRPFKHLYFRPEGNPPDRPMQRDQEYHWNTTLENWFDEETGGSARTWVNGSGFANIRIQDNADGAVIAVQNDIHLGGLASPRFDARAVYTLRSADPDNPVTFTFEDNSRIELGGTTSTRRVAIENINIVGNPLISRDRTVFVDIPRFDGAITVETVIGIVGDTNARVHLANGHLHTYASRGMTLSRLSGAGTVSRASGMGFTRARITLDQSDNTVLGGRGFANADTSFTKAGAGTFIVAPNGAGTQWFRALDIEQGGAFFSDTALTAVLDVHIAAGAVLGGTLSLTGDSRCLILSTAASTLAPGRPQLDDSGHVVQRAGPMTLAADVTGNEGGTFNFYVDDDGGNGQLVNSRIDVTGGTLTLGGTKTVNLHGLDAGLLETGVAYTLMDVSGAGALSPGWDNSWEIGINDTGHEIESFGWNGDQLQLVLATGPEHDDGDEPPTIPSLPDGEAFRITRVWKEGDQIRIEFSGYHGAAGVRFSMQAATELTTVPGNWDVIDPDILRAQTPAPSTTWSDENASTSPQRYFYRLEAVFE